MSQRVQRIALAYFLLASTCLRHASGFAPSSSFSFSSKQRRSRLAMSSSASPPSSSSHPSVVAAAAAAAESYYPQLLASASICASSEGCPIETAESYLRAIFLVQSGCAAGTVSGSGVCDDVTVVGEVGEMGGGGGRVSGGGGGGGGGVVVVVVGGWKHCHFKSGSRELGGGGGEGCTRDVALRVFSTFWDRRREELPKPAYLALAALYAVACACALHPPDASVVVVAGGGGGVSPLAAQEMWWAVRDGYVGDVVAHVFRNGGLLVGGDVLGDALSSAASSLTTTIGDGDGVVVGNAPLSPQELFWSIRDGYAGNTLFSTTGVVIGGGGGGGGILEESSVVPFTPQEVWWAIKNGYAHDMIEHWFRNGGLLV
ncbi:hypothetical protein ACHAW5_000352 [Stephanodiscus triporus]|uniref:Subtilisin n=1 Tax=Stephanodiscus triporus TaxID=2934178 RepID=A0ABD3MIK1_9STRA